MYSLDDERLAQLGITTAHGRRTFSTILDFFENLDRSLVWLKTPRFSLSNRAPIQIINTEEGALEIERLIGRLDHGVF